MRLTTSSKLRLVLLASLTTATLPVNTVAAAQTSTAKELSILEIYNFALKHDANLAAAKARLDAKLEVKNQTRALFLPKVALKADTKINDSTTTNEPTDANPFSSIGAGSRHYNSHGYNLSLIQPLLDMNSIYKIPESEIKINQARVFYHIASQAIIAQTGQVYINTLIAEEDLQVALAEQKAIEEQLQKAKLAFELGTSTITDTNEAQAARDLIYAKVIAKTNDLEVARHKLRTLTGQGNVNLQRIRGSLPIDDPSLQVPEYKTLLDVAMKANSQLLLSNLDYALSRVQLSQKKSGRLPVVNAFASYGTSTANGSTFSDTNSETDFYTGGVELTLPLYSGGATSSFIREAASTVEEKKQILTDKKRSTELELQQSYLLVNLARSQVIAFKQAVKTSTSSLESTKVGFDLGERTVLDVLAVQKNYYQAIRDLANAQYQYVLAVLSLSYSAGILSDKDIIRVAETIANVPNKHP
jgi:outer membrane protein